MIVMELLTHYSLDKLSPSDLELFAYYSYQYGVDYDEANHPYFYLRLFTSVSTSNPTEYYEVCNSITT